jgi:His/Glu/Gln/Arg/opine family amino acid ABC transporter permease subunit
MAFDLTVLLQNRDLLASGLLVTVGTSLAGIIAAFLLAVPLVLMKLARPAWLRWPAHALIEALRNAPFIVLLVLVHFGIQHLLGRVPPWESGVLALTLYGAAYFAEVLRGAFLSVPRGQIEAAHAVGLSWMQGLVAVVAPQMVAPAVPSLRVVAVMLIKESAVLSIIAVPELTHAALRIQAETFETIPVFAAIALLYWSVTLSAAAVAHRIEGSARAKRSTTLRRSGIAARYLTLDWNPR